MLLTNYRLSVLLVISAIMALMPDSGHVVLAAEREPLFYVYAPSAGQQQLLIVAATETDNGLELTLQERFDLGFPASSITTRRDRPLIYLCSSRSEGESTPGTVIESNHRGRVLKQSNFKTVGPHGYISLDPSHRFLLGSNYGSGQVDVYALDDRGLPHSHVTRLDEGRKFAHCALLSPNNRFLYIPYVKENNALYQYAFDETTGHVTPLNPKAVELADEIGPRHLAYHPTLPIAYFSNEQQLGVSVYEMKSTGNLELLQISSAVDEQEPKEGVTASDIAITPDGRFVYVGIRGHTRDFDWIARYRVGNDGLMQPLGLTPADKLPWGFALSPDGRYLMVTATIGATLVAYRIGPDGDLTKSGSLSWDMRISDLIAR